MSVSLVWYVVFRGLNFNLSISPSNHLRVYSREEEEREVALRLE